MRCGVLQPKRPVLFVGNHTLFGIYDSPILFHEVNFFVPVIFSCGCIPGAFSLLFLSESESFSLTCILLHHCVAALHEGVPGSWISSSRSLEIWRGARV
jgi:hypothetical protein